MGMTLNQRNSARGYSHRISSGVRHLTFSRVQRDRVSSGVRHLTFSGVQRNHVSSRVQPSHLLGGKGVRGVRHLTFSGVQRDHVSSGVWHLTFSGVRGVQGLRHLTFSGVQRDHVSSGVRHLIFSGVRHLTVTADNSPIMSARGYKSHLLGADKSTLLTPWHLTKWRPQAGGLLRPHDVSAAPHDVGQCHFFSNFIGRHLGFGGAARIISRLLC